MKKISKIFLSFVLILSLVLQIIPKKILAESNDTTKITVAVFTENTHDDGTAKYDYYTGEDVSGFAEISISGNQTTLKNPKTVLTIPKENILGAPVYPKSETATSFGKTEDDENWYITFNFDKLVGGQSIVIPFIFKWKQPMTPNGFKTPVTYELFNSLGISLKKARVNFIARTYPIDSLHRVAGDTVDNEGELSGILKNVRDINGNRVKVALIDNLNSNELVYTKSGKDAPYASFEIGVTSENSDYGKFAPSEVKIIDKLPAGAVMEGTVASDGYYHYQYRGREYKWRYNAADHTATYIGDLDPILRTATIKLQFPNQRYETVHRNTATIILDSGTSNEQRLQARSAYVKWDARERQAIGKNEVFKRAWKLDYAFAKHMSPLSEIPQFILRASNKNNNVAGANGHVASLSLTEIEDFNLDHRMYYKSIRINKIGTTALARKLTEVGYKIYGVTADETEVFLGGNMPKDTRLEINDTEGKYKKLIVRTNQPLEISNDILEFAVETPVKDEIWAKWKLNPQSEDVDGIIRESKLRNSVNFRYYDTSDSEKTIKTEFDRALIHYILEKREVSSENGSDHTVIYGNNDEQEMYANIKIRGELAAITEKNPASNYRIEGLKHVSILPTGVEYVPDSGTRWEHKESARVKKEPQVVKNYRNTGKTAVIFDLSDVEPMPIEGTPLHDFRAPDAGIGFKINMTLYAKEGDNVIDHYLVWDNTDEVGLPKPSGLDPKASDKTEYTDALDLNANGNTNEKLLHGTNTIRFVPPREIIFRKYVSLDKNEWTLDAPLQDLGSNVFYKLNLFNNAPRSLRTAHILDVLPYQGDHSIVPNGRGRYLPRESIFTVKLNAFLEDIEENAEVLQKWSVLYSTDAQANTLNSTRDANFVPKERIRNIKDVKMFKIILNTNEELPASSEANFIVSAQLPYTKSLNTGDFAKNSAAVSTNGVDYIEGNRVTTPILKYTVDGTVFNDLNTNNLWENGDVVLPGYTLQLMKYDATPALDERGQPIVTISDDQGHYHFDVYERGEYYVKIIKGMKELTGLTSTKIENGNHGIQVVNKAEDGITDTFSLDPLNPTVIRNFGFINSNGTIFITKVNEDLAPLENVEFTLYKDGIEVAKETTDAKGKITFDNLEFGEYTVQETRTLPEYEIDPNQYEVAISQAEPVMSGSFSNEYKRGNIVLAKKDGDTNQPLAGVTFDLKEDDVVIQSATSDQNGIVRFENLKYGEYVVVEKETLPSHILDTTEYTVDLNQSEVIKEITNAKIKGNIKVIKTDAEDSSRLEGVHFELQKTGRKVQEGTTNAAGELLFTDIPYGTYQLVETQAKEGYTLNTTPEEVTISENGVEVAKEITNTKIKGSIKVVKTDADDNTPLAGVTFKLYNGNVLIASKTTNAEGVIVFENVPYGTYQLIETQAKDGYALNATPEEVAVSEDGVEVTKEITNTKIKRNVKVIKTDAADGSKLAGVEFALQKDGSTIATQTTDANGEITFEDVEYGTYQLVETQAKEGYVLNSQPQEVIVSADEESVTKTFTNDKIKGSIKVIKTDAVDGSRLGNVRFDLVQNGTVISSLRTNANGEIIFENIPYGTYSLVEKETKNGYVLNSVPEEVVIEEDGVVVTKEITNTKIEGSIKVVKTDVDDNTPLAGVTFELRKGRTKVNEKTTNADGEIVFENVPYGTYNLVETHTKEGYVLDKAPIKVAVSENGTVVTKEITNRKIKGNVHITKKDAEDGSKLAGVEFALQKDGTTIVKQKTDANGEITFNNVEYGTYQLVETQAKEGYVLNTTPREIIIETDNEAYNLILTNEKIKGNIKVIKTDADDNTPLEDVTFELRQGETKVSEEITDEEGVVVFENIPYGTYQLVETHTKDGYVLNSTPEEVIVSENGVEVTKEITNAKIKGNIKVVKKDAEDSSKLEGATFELRKDGTKVQEGITNADGELLFTDVLYGNYQIVETQAKEGYVLDATPQEVAISENGVEVVKEITNTKIKGSVKVIKTDTTDGSRLAGVEFALQKGGNTIATQTTNANGEITFENVEYGTYQLIETQAKEGYVLDTTPQEVVVSENGTVVTKEFTNTKIKGNIKVVKTDSEDNSKLAGVTFELRKDGLKVQEGITNAEGVIVFENIPYGTYQLVETSTKEGYVLNSDPQEVVVNENGAEVIKEITNTKIKGSIKVIKTDAVDGSKLEGVHFDLVQNGATIASLQTNADGIIVFENIPYGTYSLVEKEAKDGYVLNSAPEEVIIHENGVVVTKEITNTKIKANVKVIKTDAEDSSKLEGVQFELRKDGKVVQSGTTNVDGEFVFENIPYGTYQLVEIHTKEGYVLNTNPEEVVVSENGVEVTKEITNTKIKGNIKVVKKDADDNTPLAGVAFELRQNGTKVQSGTTNADGELLFTDVLYGNYQIVETQAKEGYVLNEQPQEVAVSENGVEVIKEITNTKIKGNVKVIKKDIEDNSKLSEVEFTLQKDGNTIATKTTNAEGVIVFENIPYGTYSLVETRPKEGYVLDATPQEVVVSENGAEVVKEITNAKIKANVKVVKVDETDGSKLEGVEFVLQKDGNTIATQSTDANGEITFENIAYGTYKLVETSTKEGYVLNSNPQEVVVSENGVEVVKEVTNAKIKGSIKVIKKDADDESKLEDVRFDLMQNGTTVASLRTNANGEIVFENIPYGTYSLVEKEAKNGYVLNADSQEVTIQENGVVVTKTITNAKIKANVKVIKTDAEDRSKLAEVTFELRNGDAIIASQATNAEGIIVFENIPYGTYQLVETQTKAGYVLNTTPEEVVVSENGVEVVKEITNTKIKGSIKVIKKDAEDNSKLEGVHFELRQNGTKVQEKTTNADGEATFENVVYGTYQLVETSTKEGYVLNAEPQEVVVSENGVEIAKEITNTKIKANVKVIKKDAEDNSKLEGVHFELRQNGTKVQEKTTNADGEITFENVVYGTYQLVETSTKEGYVLNEQPQEVVVSENGVEVVKEITNTKIKANVKVIKKDAEDNSKLAGATFELRKDGTKVQEGITNADGELQFSDVVYGNYQIVETKAKEGYVLNTTPVEVIVSENGAEVTKEITNTKIKGNVKVIKTDAEDNSKLADVEFALQKDGNTIATQRTDANGEAVFENIPYGTYTLVETQTKEGYVLNTQSQEVIIHEDGLEVVKEITNTKIKANVKVIKKDAEDNSKLAGATFELRKDGTKVQEGITNADGELLFTNVVYGNYQIVETKATEGYVLNADPQEVVVSENGTEVTKEITNTKIKANVKVIKTDAEDNSKLEGVTFELRKDGTKVQEKVTNAEGIAVFENIPYGTYTLVETQTTEGYVLNTQSEQVVVSQDGIEVTKEITNTKIKANVKVIKTDAEDNSKLEGVTFELRDGDSVVASKETNAEGIALFENVPYGTYQLVETKAKEGYVLNTTPEEVVVNENGVEVVKEITNKKIKGNIHILKADKLDGTPIEGAKFELLTFTERTKVQEGITNADGELRFTDIPYGLYIIVETQAKEGYLLGETKEIINVAENDATYTSEFVNEKIKGSIKVVKTDAEDNGKLSEVRFDLLKDGEVLASRTTNEEGVIIFEDLDYGPYTLIEKRAKDGYVLNAEPQEVFIRENGVEVTKEITNTKIKGSIKVIKKDAEDGSKLEGVQFELQKDGQKVQEKVTDANGEIVFENVTVGTYNLVETQTKEGYVLNADPQEVLINEDGKVVEVTFTNTKIKGNIKVIKTDAEDGSKLEGVQFELQKDGQKVQEKATNVDGELVFENVEYGTYSLVETKTKEGYVLNEQPEEVSINTNEEIITKEITNTKIKGNIKVIKTDAEDGSKLEGVQFNLYKDGEVVQKGTTDANGEITFKDVVFGTYSLLETKEKDGYIPIIDEEKVVVSENGKTVEVTITNQKQPVISKIERPKSNSDEPKGNSKTKEKVDTSDDNSFGTLLFLLLTSAFILYRRKKY